MQKRIWSIATIVLLGLNGCSGSVDDSIGGGTTTDTTAPVFTNSDTVSVHLNQNIAITLAAIDNVSIVSYAISGTDSASFDIDTESGAVRFKTAPDYDIQNMYTFAATATDASANVATQNVTINILNTIMQGIKRTGQTLSHDASGNEVTDGSLKDDGYYQRGLTPVYTAASDMVTDELTGLMWQDDITVSKTWLTLENYQACVADTSSPACFDTSGDTATSYCTALSLGGYTDWRLPTSAELESIIDHSKNTPSIDTAYFNHWGNYLSSNTYKGDNSLVWHVDFEYGEVDYDDKYTIYQVRCVRNGQ